MNIHPERIPLYIRDALLLNAKTERTQGFCLMISGREEGGASKALSPPLVFNGQTLDILDVTILWLHFCRLGVNRSAHVH